ncbi:MAG: hypothetical protein ACK4VO_06300 [Pseudobdellovibrio sp.]
MMSKIAYKALLLICIFSFFSCGKVNNSSSLDRIYYSASRPTGSTLFLSVNNIVGTKCAGCHPAWISFSETDFVAGGLVVAGSPESSKLYYRNQSATSGPGPRNMPSSGFPALTTDETQTLVDWINSL